MPKIRTVDVGPQGLQPTEIGIDALAGAARRQGAFYNQVGEATQRFGQEAGREIGGAIRAVGDEGVSILQHQEVSHGAATFAQLNLDLSEKWNQMAKGADPNDPSVAAKFRETVLEPELQKFSSGFNTEGGQKWAEGHIDAFRSHMFEKTTADMATLAGQAARVNHIQTVNSLSNMVLNDPSALDYALKSHDSATTAVVDTSPNLKGAAAGNLKGELTEKGREQIVKSAAIGYINKTGQVPAWATDPKYSKYVNGPELQTLQKQAQTVQKADLVADNTLKHQRQQDADRRATLDANKAFTDSVKVDPNDPNKIIIDPAMARRALDVAYRNPDAANAKHEAEGLINWMQAKQREHAEPITSDPATLSSLLTNVADPSKSTFDKERAVLFAEIDHKLATREGNMVRQLIKLSGPDVMHDPQVHSALQAATERLGVNLVGDGHERYNQFFQGFWPDYLRQKNSGTLPANALNTKDEKSLISQYIAQHEPPAAERMMMHQLKLMGISNIDQVTKAAAPAPTAPAAAKAVTLPPIETRVKGNLYDTERGKMKWTGTGWVAP